MVRPRGGGACGARVEVAQRSGMLVGLVSGLECGRGDRNLERVTAGKAAVLRSAIFAV